MDVSFADSVAGDAMAAGASVSAEGPVRGDLLAAGGRVTASGPVGGSVRAAGGEVTVDGSVERNVTAAGGSVRIGAGGRVRGNAYLSGGEIVVDGHVAGHLRASGGVVRILGSVDGSVDVTAERVVVGPAARIGGDLTHRSPDPAEVASGARIGGAVTHRPADGGGALAAWIGRLVRVGAFLFTGGVLVALFPGAADRLRETLGERPVPSVGLGLAALVGVPLALVLVGLTVLGLPLMLIGGALFAAALYVARAVLALWLGERLLGRGPARARRVAAFLVGGALLALAGLVPWVGWLVTLAATVAGVGAAVELLTRRWRQSGEAARV
jgi:cytoskeletal protein CcmA (bactofilin family)